ncbi:MAG: hypothetical protein QM756_09185 [Polyangiaceae bacterium]
MRCRSLLSLILFCTGCGGASTRPVATSPKPTPPAAPAPIPTAPAPTPAAEAAPSIASAEDPKRWLRVHVGTRLTSVEGTELLHDATGQHWFSLKGDELERIGNWNLDRFLVAGKDENGELHPRRLKWVVGDARGPLYAFVDEIDAPCASVAEPFFLHFVEGEWRSTSIALGDPTPPRPLRSGDFGAGLVLVDSVNPCGHGGRPFDYRPRLHGGSARWPSPRHFTAPFMRARKTFSEIAFESFALTPRGDLVVLGFRRGRDQNGELSDIGLALEIFRVGAKRTEIVPLPEWEPQYSTKLGLEIGSENEIILAAPNGDEQLVYRGGTWAVTERTPSEDEKIAERVSDALSAAPLLVDGEPFMLLDAFRHAGVLFFVGTAGNREITFVESRVRWRAAP